MKGLLIALFALTTNIASVQAAAPSDGPVMLIDYALSVTEGEAATIRNDPALADRECVSEAVATLAMALEKCERLWSLHRFMVHNVTSEAELISLTFQPRIGVPILDNLLFARALAPNDAILLRFRDVTNTCKLIFMVRFRKKSGEEGEFDEPVDVCTTGYWDIKD